MTHELKTWPEFFEAIQSGKKKFEVRKNDRDFKTGDTLLLKEYDPFHCSVKQSFDEEPPQVEPGTYTGREIRASVIYVLEDHTGSFGIQPGFVVMSIKVKK